MPGLQTILHQLEALLPPVTLGFLRAAGDLAARKNLRLFLVGGSVRDLLLGRPVLDLDLVVDGDAPRLAADLAQKLGGAVTARSQFGTAKLRTQDMTLDLVSARRESYPHPGALPAVQPGSLEDDLARRDFTIHAMAASLEPERFGGLVDPFGGQEDLRQRLLRVLHPKSFADDATRILRALRYEQRLGFRMEPDTEALARRDKGHLDAISGDRLRHELERIFQEPRPEDTLERARGLSVLAQILPTMDWPEGSHEALQRWRAQGETAQPLLFAALLAAPLTPGEGAALAKRLNAPVRWRRILRDAAALKERLPALAAGELRPSQAFQALRELEPTAVQAWAVLAPQGQVRQRLLAHWKQWRHVRSKLNGHHLLALGVPPGPKVGQVLEALLQARLDGLVTSREDEEKFVRQSAPCSPSKASEPKGS